MFQNVLMTTLTPLHAKNEINCWENRPFITKWPENKQNKGEISRPIKKKPKRSRTSFSTEQLNQLEEAFQRHHFIDPKKRTELANQTKIGERQIKIWFQNRRMKLKKQLSESSECDSSNYASSSPLVTTSVTEEPLIREANNYSVYPQFNLPETNHIQLSGFPEENGLAYYDAYRNTYPIEYLPVRIENNHDYSNFFTGVGSDQFPQPYYNNQNANWYGYDLNNFQNGGSSL